MLLNHHTMKMPASLLTLASVLLAGAIAPAHGQSDPERKVRIEVITSENGDTRTITKELDAGDEAAIQEALREMGVLDHFHFDGDAGQVRIDIRDFDMLKDMDWSAMAAPHIRRVEEIVHGPGTTWLGVSTAGLDQVPNKPAGALKAGAVVQHVSKDSPAAILGLQQGDVITLVDKTTIAGPAELVQAIRDHASGDEVKLTWYRAGKKMSGTATLAARSQRVRHFTPEGEGRLAFDLPAPGTKRAFLGVTPAESETGAPGVKVHIVEQGSAAQAMGMRPGDVVRAINGVDMADFDALAKHIGTMAPGEAVQVIVERDGRTMELQGELGERPGQRTDRTFHFEGLDPEMQEDLRRQLDDLRMEFDQLREEMGRGEPGQLRREMRIIIQSKPLDQAEKDLLTKHGVAGLDKELELGGLHCFPNPSNGFFRLQFEVAERADLTVHVHDSTGEKIYDERIGAFKGRYERTLDLSDKAAGTYYLVIAQNGRTATQKLVKQ